MMSNAIEQRLSVYPELAKQKFMEVRALILSVAEVNQLGPIEETLKWGQPSYLCKSGSTIRLDWSKGNPLTLDVFFNCKTILVETFKEVFADELHYRGNRVVELPLNQPTPVVFESCILMALNYHRLKKQPLLGQ